MNIPSGTMCLVSFCAVHNSDRRLINLQFGVILASIVLML